MRLRRLAPSHHRGLGTCGCRQMVSISEPSGAGTLPLLHARPCRETWGLAGLKLAQASCLTRQRMPAAAPAAAQTPAIMLFDHLAPVRQATLCENGCVPSGRGLLSRPDGLETSNTDRCAWATLQPAADSSGCLQPSHDRCMWRGGASRAQLSPVDLTQRSASTADRRLLLSLMRLQLWQQHSGEVAGRLSVSAAACSAQLGSTLLLGILPLCCGPTAAHACRDRHKSN